MTLKVKSWTLFYEDKQYAFYVCRLRLFYLLGSGFILVQPLFTGSLKTISSRISSFWLSKLNLNVHHYP